MLSTLRAVAWTIFLTSLLIVAAFAGSGPGKMTSVRITTMSTFRPTIAGQGEINTYLTRWFESQGVKVIDKSEWVVWFNAIPASETDTNRVILLIGIGHTLPKEAIEVGRKSEIFYSNLPAATKASLPAEGKWVREYVTEGFLYEFMYPLEEKLELVPREKLLERVDAIVNDLCVNQLKD